MVDIPHGVSEVDALQKTSVVVGAAKTALLSGKVQGVKVDQRTDTAHTKGKVVGDDTSSIMDEIAEGLSAVLRALDGAAAGVVSHRRSVLANEERTREQIRHRDDKAEAVVARMNPSQVGKRGRPEPPPFSAVCSFRRELCFTSSRVVTVVGEKPTSAKMCGMITPSRLVGVTCSTPFSCRSEDEHVHGHMYLTAVGRTLRCRRLVRLNRLCGGRRS